MYYILATLVPIDKIIGKFYPFFGALLLFMSFGLTIGLIFSDYKFYSVGLDFFTNYDPSRLPVWPLLFVTISCGAISGFHATQSPLMARCISNFRAARLIIADLFKLSQKDLIKRLYIAIPLFILGIAISNVNFDIIWRYFG